MRNISRQKWIANANRYLDDIISNTGEYVWSKSSPERCEKPWATRRILNLCRFPFASNFLEKNSMWPTGGFVSSVDTSPNTWCFLREAYSVSSALLHYGHSGEALASASEAGSGATLVLNVVRCTLVDLEFNGASLLIGSTLSVPGNEFRSTRGPE